MFDSDRGSVDRYSGPSRKIDYKTENMKHGGRVLKKKVRTKRILATRKTLLTRQEKLDRKRNLNYRPQSVGPRKKIYGDDKGRKGMMGMITKAVGAAAGGMKKGGISKKYENGGSTDKYGKRHARLKEKGYRLARKSMDPKNDDNDKRFNRQYNRSRKAFDKAREIRTNTEMKRGGISKKYNQGGEVQSYKESYKESMEKGGLTRKKGEKRKKRLLTRQEILDKKRNLNYRPQSAGPLPLPSRRFKQDKESARALAPVKKERKNKKAMMGMIAKAAAGAMGK